MNVGSSQGLGDSRDRLESSLRQEIGAMREMLANMKQEELSLLAQDKKAWTQVMLERVDLLVRLSELRLLRFNMTQAFNILVVQENDCEILSMRDQLTALVEKMNQQQRRIQYLEGHKVISTLKKLEEPSTKESIKKKGAIATYPPDS